MSNTDCSKRSRFEDKLNGTILDYKTNLIWQKKAYSRLFSWKEAVQYCKQLRLGGYSDWRLPTVDELKTIVDKTYTPTVNPIFDCKKEWYWSGTTSDTNDQVARYICFYYGCPHYSEKTELYHVRAVRNNV